MSEAQKTAPTPLRNWIVRRNLAIWLLCQQDLPQAFVADVFDLSQPQVSRIAADVGSRLKDGTGWKEAVLALLDLNKE